MSNLHVVYNPALCIPDSKFITHKKPAYVVTLAHQKGYTVHDVERPACSEDLYLVHAKQYVDGVVEGSLQNGFGNNSPAINWQAQWASGAMLKGVQVALEHGNCLVPASGYHHAGYASNWGYCTFNGMMLAAVCSGKKTLIIDGDAHYGDGCVDIINTLGIKNIDYMQWFDTLKNMPFIQDYELVIYQPGADSMEEGPTLTLQEFRTRDWNVFSHCIAAGVPVLWCLGGGYSSLGDVVKAHSGSINMLVSALELQKAA